MARIETLNDLDLTLAVLGEARRKDGGGVTLSGEPTVEGNEPALKRFVMSDGGVDRVGDVIEPEGWKLERFRENPVMLWAHDYRSPPVGRWPEVWVSGGKLIGRAEFAGTDMGRDLEGLYEKGFLRAVSVGFLPLKWELRRSEEGKVLGFRFIEQELLECSAVPVPANPGALEQGVDRRGADAEEWRALVRHYFSEPLARGVR